MTDRRRYAAALVLAPVAVGALSVTTGWAVDHDPRGSGTPVAHAAPASSVQALEARVAAATHRYETARVRLLDAQRRIHANARLLDGLSRTHASSSSSLPGAAPPAPSVPAPAAPPVSTTTGAS